MKKSKDTQDKNKDKTLSYEGQSVHIGLDIHKKRWKVGIYTPRGLAKVFSQDPDSDLLYRHLCRYYPGARYHSVYEAGYSGFWLHEELLALGISNIVVNPSDIPTSQKDRRRKTDRRDAKKLGQLLRSGCLSGIYHPSPSAQGLRSLVRRRSQLVKSQSRCKNQIKSLLAFYGIAIPSEWKEGRWGKGFLRWLSDFEVSSPCIRLSLDSFLRQLASLSGEIKQIERSLRRLSTDDEARSELLAYLQSIPGIGFISAWVIYSELIQMERFKSQDHLQSYCGLVPDVSASGERESVKGVTHRRNAHLRKILIECSWVAIQRDPHLKQAFEHYCKRMKKQKAIIRVAKKLLNTIRALWLKRCRYQRPKTEEAKEQQAKEQGTRP